jgi:hypothetical protein
MVGWVKQRVDNLATTFDHDTGEFLLVQDL